MASMEGCEVLECIAGPDQSRLAQAGGDELEADRQSRLAEPTRQRDCGTAGHVEWAGVALQFSDEVRLVPQRLDPGKA